MVTVFFGGVEVLTHWGRVMHICVSKLNIIASDNGLSPGQHQAIIWTNAGILLIKPSGTNFSEILIRIQIFSFTKNVLENVVCKMAFILCRSQCVKSSVSMVFIDLDNALSNYWIHNNRTNIFHFKNMKHSPPAHKLSQQLTWLYSFKCNPKSWKTLILMLKKTLWW